MEETLKKYKYKKLKELCKKENIKGYSKFKKSELIKFIIENRKTNFKSCKTCEEKIDLDESFINHTDEIYEHLKCYNKARKEKGEILKCDKYECSICLDNIEDNFFVTDCGHQFHKKCILKWYNSSQECPNCRGHIYEILTIDGFVLKLDDKIKDNALILSKTNGKKRRKLKSKLETEFRLIIHNYLDFYIQNTTEPREVAMNTIYTMIDSLAFR
jgi:hypothetical protein